MGEAKQIEAEREGYGTQLEHDIEFAMFQSYCAKRGEAHLAVETCTPESPCQDCRWSDKQDANNQ